MSLGITPFHSRLPKGEGRILSAIIWKISPHAFFQRGESLNLGVLKEENVLRCAVNP
jgi:hypothetical protein